MDRATFGSLVWQLSTRWRTELDRVVAPFGLTQAQYSALATLAHLCRTSAPSQIALAQALGMTPIYASKLLRALEAEGLVKRRPDPEDSRARCLALTPEGEARLALARAEVVALDRRLTEPLGPDGAPNAEAFRILLRSLLTHHASLGQTP